jgi:hypothetical protein
MVRLWLRCCQFYPGEPDYSAERDNASCESRSARATTVYEPMDPLGFGNSQAEPISILIYARYQRSRYVGPCSSKLRQAVKLEVARLQTMIRWPVQDAVAACSWLLCMNPWLALILTGGE